MNELQDYAAGEFRHLSDTPESIQKTLNQWKHLYKLRILKLEYSVEGHIRAFVYREAK